MEVYHKQMPFLWQHDIPEDVTFEQEAAEVLAYAFNYISKDFFKNRKKKEDIISGLVSENEKAKSYGRCLLPGILFLVVAIISAGLVITTYFIEMNDLFWSLGLGISAFSLALGFPLFLTGLINRKKSRKFHIAIVNLTQEKEIMIPEKRISFLSKVMVPVYLMPFDRKKSVLVDPMKRAKDYNFSLVTIHEQEVQNAHSNFIDWVKYIEKRDKNEPVIPIDKMMKYHPDVMNDDFIERGLYNSIESIKQSFHKNNWIHDSVNLSIFKQKTKIGKRIKTNFNNFHNFRNEPSVILQSRYDLNDQQSELHNLYRIKNLTLNEEFNEQMMNFGSNLESTIEPILNNYETAALLLDDNSEDTLAFINDLSYNEYCKECREIHETESLAEKYDLGIYIYRKFEESIIAMYSGERCMKCGYTLYKSVSRNDNCPDCGNITIAEDSHSNSPQAKAERLIKRNIKADLNNIPLVPILNIDRLTYTENENYLCATHKRGIDIEKFLKFNEIFAYTSINLWQEMVSPIRKKADEANVIVTRNRQKFNDQMIALLPYEQLMQDLYVRKKTFEGIAKTSNAILEVGGY